MHDKKKSIESIYHGTFTTLNICKNYIYCRFGNPGFEGKKPILIFEILRIKFPKKSLNSSISTKVIKVLQWQQSCGKNSQYQGTSKDDIDH